MIWISNRKIERELKINLTETEYGEPQSWIYLQSGRCIEVTHEQYGLKQEEYFFSIRLHCSNEEFDNDDYQSTCGIIDTCNTSLQKEIIKNIKNILKNYNEKIQITK